MHTDKQPTLIKGFIGMESIFSVGIVESMQHNIHYRLVTNTASKHLFDEGLITLIKFLHKYTCMSPSCNAVEIMAEYYEDK